MNPVLRLQNALEAIETSFADPELLFGKFHPLLYLQPAAGQKLKNILLIGFPRPSFRQGRRISFRCELPTDGTVRCMLNGSLPCPLPVRVNPLEAASPLPCREFEFGGGPLRSPGKDRSWPIGPLGASRSEVSEVPSLPVWFLAPGWWLVRVMHQNRRAVKLMQKRCDPVPEERSDIGLSVRVASKIS